MIKSSNKCRKKNYSVPCPYSPLIVCFFSDEYKEDLPDIKDIIKRNVRKSCNRNLILNRLPPITWLPKYEKKFLYEDLVAGITVGLTAIPQGIAYAVVAGLEPQYGLYAGFMGCFVYFLFGSCKDITIGPTAIMALMVQRYVSASPDFAVLAAFLSGVVIFVCGLLNLGFLIQFISVPVTAGFTSAAAITIASGQVKSILGLPGKSNEFIEAWKTVFEHISETKLWDIVLGITTLIFLLVLRVSISDYSQIIVFKLNIQIAENEGHQRKLENIFQIFFIIT